MLHRPRFHLAAVVALAFLPVAALSAQDDAAPSWSVDPERSLFAVVTHKEGLASGLAHEHLVVARDADVLVRFDPDQPSSAFSTVEVTVDELLIDDPALLGVWEANLLERGLLAEEFADLSQKQRRKIRRSMLDEDQLDAEAHPTIRAILDDVRMEDGEGVGRLELVVKGESATREIRFDWPGADPGDELVVDASASFAFTDFGIEPYSALLGSIRVTDAFDVVIRLVATREPSPAP